MYICLFVCLFDLNNVLSRLYKDSVFVLSIPHSA